MLGGSDDVLIELTINRYWGWNRNPDNILFHYLMVPEMQMNIQDIDEHASQKPNTLPCPTSIVASISAWMFSDMKAFFCRICKYIYTKIKMYLYTCMYVMHGCMNAWMHGCMDAWMHGCMDAWMYA